MSRRQSVPLNMFLRQADPIPPLFPEPNEGDFYFNTSFHVVRIYREVEGSDPVRYAWQDLTTGGAEGLGRDTSWTIVGPYDPGDPSNLPNPDGINSTPIWIDTDAGIDDGGGTGSGGGHIIQEEGVPLPPRPNLNFTGFGVTASDGGQFTRVAVPIQTLVQPTPPPTTLPEGTWWVDEDSTVPEPLQTRTTTTKATGALAAGAGESGYITLSRGYRLYRILTNYPCRTRLYTTAAKRDADIDRPIGTDPILDHGVMFEFISATSPDLLTADLSPTIDGYDGKPVPDGVVPYRITNIDTVTRTIVVTLDWLRTE